MFTFKTVSNWPKTQGIYLIRNKINNKVYVGHTRDNLGFKRRWASHRQLLRGNRHDNFHLQNSYNEYGEDCFELEVLEEMKADYLNKETRQIFEKNEANWMIKLNSTFPEFGYNTNPLKEYRRPGQNAKRTLPVFQFRAPNGDIISGQNIGGFARSLGLGAWGFRELAAGRKAEYMGYMTIDPEVKKKFEKEPKYTILDPQENKYHFDSIPKFAKDHGLIEQVLSAVLLGKCGHTNGWHLENPDPKFIKIIEDFNKTYMILMPDGKIHKFKNLRAVMITLKVTWESAKSFFEGKTKFRKSVILSQCSIPTEDQINELEIIEEKWIPTPEMDRSKHSSSKKVDQFDLEGNYIKTFNSTNEAQKTINYQRVRKAVTQPFILQAGGFYWKYSESN